MKQSNKINYLYRYLQNKIITGNGMQYNNCFNSKYKIIDSSQKKIIILIMNFSVLVWNRSSGPQISVCRKSGTGFMKQIVCEHQVCFSTTDSSRRTVSIPTIPCYRPRLTCRWTLFCKTQSLTSSLNSEGNMSGLRLSKSPHYNTSV